MNITLRKLDPQKAKSLENLINALTSIESVEINDLSYDIEDKTELFTKARVLAMQKAKQKATELAKLAEVQIGKPFALAEEISYQPIFYGKMVSQSNSMMTSDAMGEEAGSTVSLGQLKVSVAINVSYPLQ